MSYKEKPQIKLYKYENSAFVLQAIIDDFQECSFEHNLYEAGQFTISINYNIPNALKFERGLFVQFGNNPYDFGEIITIQDAIGQDGKGSQIRTITGRDARYILKRRVIKNMNSNGLWAMTDKGEIVLRNLIKDQCGSSAETKRQLPIANTIPSSASAKGKEYSASESFSNLYEVCKTIATQSEIGWRMAFDGTLTLEVFSGQDLSQTVRFDTNYESLANGDFSDSSESYSNAIYIGGKGQNDDRDIYEGEDGTPQGLDRFESWDNQSSLTVESEYEAEALSMLTQYGQTLTMNGNGLAKCPYVFREQYDIGDTVTVAFSGKSATAQILSITEHWTWGSYDISFAFGKPQNNLADQLQLMLRKIQEASNKTNSTDSVRWYTIPTDTAMPKADVTYNTIGFVGTVGTGATFTLYLDNEKTGAKTYHVYFKQLGGTGKLTLTTGKAGATDLVLNSGTYVAIIYVDENGNVTNTASTPTNTIEAGNTQPATSDGVYGLTSTGTDSSKTNANLCYAESTRVAFFRLNTGSSNCPPSNSTNPTYIEAFTYNNRNNIRVTQIAYDNFSGTASYIRSGYKNAGDTNITWTSWGKIAKSEDINNPLIKTFSNNTANNKIIHLGTFSSSYGNRTRCNIWAEARRADGSYRIMASVYQGYLKKGVSDTNTDYFDLYLYKTNDYTFDLYLFIGSYIDTVYVNLTDYAEFTYDGTEVTSYTGNITNLRYDKPLQLFNIGNNSTNVVYWKLTGLIPQGSGESVYLLQSRAGELIILSCGHGDGATIATPKAKRLLDVYSKIDGIRYNGQTLYLKINPYSHECILTMIAGTWIRPFTIQTTTQTEYDSATQITIET